MRVVLVTSVPASLQFLKGHVRFLQSQGVEIHVISSPLPALKEFATTYGVAAHGIPLRRRISPLRDLAALCRLAICLWRIRPDIVHAHTPKAGLLATLAAFLIRVPVRLYHIHGLPLATARGLKRWVLKLSDFIACRLAHEVFCVSLSLQEAVAHEQICPRSKLSVLEKGTIDGIDATEQFNPSRFSPSQVADLRHSLDIPDGALVVGFVGRLTRDKGIDELADAFSRLKREFSNLHLLIVGAPDEESPISPETYSALQNDSKVRLVGFTTDPAIYYAPMDVLAFPSHREGFGLVAAEAAAMQVPVVASFVTGCVDAVQADVNGLLVPPGNANELAAAIGRYLRNSELRRQHGIAGRERVLRDFSPARIHSALWRHYVDRTGQRALHVGTQRRRRAAA